MARLGAGGEAADRLDLAHAEAIPAEAAAERVRGADRGYAGITAVDQRDAGVAQQVRAGSPGTDPAAGGGRVGADAVPGDAAAERIGRTDRLAAGRVVAADGAVRRAAVARIGRAAVLTTATATAAEVGGLGGADAVPGHVAAEGVDRADDGAALLVVATGGAVVDAAVALAGAVRAATFAVAVGIGVRRIGARCVGVAPECG